MNGHLLPLLLGWLLGLLAPAITDQIKRVRSIDRIKAAIREELRAHALRMTIANFRIDEMFGQLDREKLQRIRGVYAKHGRSVKHDSLANLVEQMLGYTDEAIAAAMAKRQNRKPLALPGSDSNAMNSRICRLKSQNSANSRKKSNGNSSTS